MIGSVHGCMSCPVVVRPLEPESLSRPQHPLPSHLHAQTHPYSLTQRSSSVHPLPQNVPPDNESSCISPRKFNSGQKHSASPFHAKARDEFSSRSSSLEKNGSAYSTPPKTESANGSPKKVGPVSRSQQDFAEQFEKLLEAKNPNTTDTSVVSSPSQNIPLQSNKPDEFRSGKFVKGLHHVESQEKDPEPNLSQSKSSSRELPHSSKSPRKSSQLSDAGCQTISRTNSPTPASKPDSPKFGSSQFHGMSFSPTPLPSIQDRSKMLTRGDLPQDLPQIPFVSSLRPSKGLPSIPNPKLQPVKKPTNPYTRSSHAQRKERKSQTHSRKRSGKSQTLDTDDTGTAVKPARREPGLQEGLLTSTSVLIPQLSPIMTSASDITDKQETSKFGKSGVERMTDTSHQLCKTTTTTTLPVRDAPTPQSLDSSVWSFGQSAVAPEVDALTTAAAAGDLKKVKSLLEEGVDVNAVNTFGRTAVQVMSVDNVDLAEVLLKADADPNRQDKGRRAATSTLRTIAHDVAASGNTDMLRCLLRYGADVNLQDRWGNTPLHLAAKGGHLAAVRLLRRGTSLHLPNLDGKTPIILLEETGNPAIKQWVELKKSTVSHLKTLCILFLRQQLGPEGLRHWRRHAPDKCQRLVLLQTQGGPPQTQASASTILSSRHSLGSRSVAGKGRSNGGHPLVPGMSKGKQMTDFLSLRDLIPRRMSIGENTSLEVQNTSSGQSIDDLSLGAHATSSLASETGSLFETNLSSIEASQSADDVSLPSFDQSL